MKFRLRIVSILLLSALSLSAQVLAGKAKLGGSAVFTRAGGAASCTTPCVQTPATAYLASSATVSVSFAAQPTVGNRIIVTCGTGGSANGFNLPTDNQGHTYTALMVPLFQGAAHVNVGIWGTTVATSSGTFTVTCNRPVTEDVQIGIAEFLPKVSLTTDGTDQNEVDYPSFTGTTLTCGSITTANADDIILALAIGDLTNIAPGGAYVQQILSAARIGSLATLIVSSTGTYSPTFTRSDTTGTDYQCVSVALHYTP